MQSDISDGFFVIPKNFDQFQWITKRNQFVWRILNPCLPFNISRSSLMAGPVISGSSRSSVRAFSIAASFGCSLSKRISWSPMPMYGTLFSLYFTLKICADIFFSYILYILFNQFNFQRFWFDIVEILQKKKLTINSVLMREKSNGQRPKYMKHNDDAYDHIENLILYFRLVLLISMFSFCSVLKHTFSFQKITNPWFYVAIDRKKKIKPTKKKICESIG